MPNPPTRQLPPLGSTDRAAYEFYRMLDREELVATERARLRAMGWQPPQPDLLDAEYLDAPTHDDGQAALERTVQQQIDGRRLLEEEARRNAVIAPGWMAGGRYGLPSPYHAGDADLMPVAHTYPSSGILGSSGSAKPMFNSSGATGAGRAKTATAAAAARTAVEALRAAAPATDDTEPEPFVPREDGLGAMVAQWHRQELERPTGPEADLRHIYEAGLNNGKPRWFHDAEEPSDTTGDQTFLEQAEQIPVIGGLAGYVIQTLVDAGILENSKGDADTQGANDIIIDKILQVCRSYGPQGVHAAGGSAKPEHYYPHPATRHLGSRRPDGSLNFDDGKLILDFNTARFLRTRPIPVKHERDAAAAIQILQPVRWKTKPTMMDVFPKRKGLDSAEWERRVDEQVDKLCRAIAKQLGYKVE